MKFKEYVFRPKHPKVFLQNMEVLEIIVEGQEEDYLAVCPYNLRDAYSLQLWAIANDEQELAEWCHDMYNFKKQITTPDV